jgi:hypothetical protein
MSKNNFLFNFKLDKQEYIDTSPAGSTSSSTNEEIEDTSTSSTGASEVLEDEDKQIDAELGDGPLMGNEPQEEEEIEEGEETPPATAPKAEVKAPEAKKTASEKKEEVTEAEESYLPFINHLTEESILLINKDKKYADSPEGFQEAILDTVEAKFKEKIESLPEDAKRLVELAKEGVDIKSLIKIEEEEIPYDKIDLSDKDNQYALVLDQHLLMGYSEAEAKELVEGYKDANLLDKHSKIAVKYLAEAQNKRKEKFINDQKTAKKNEEDRKIKDQNDFKDKVLNTSKIGSFEISKTEATKLYDYMTKPVKDGKTQYELDGTEDSRMLLAYMMMNKFDSSKIEKKVETQKTKEIKKALTRFKDKSASTGSSIKTPEEKMTTTKLPSFMGHR